MYVLWVGTALRAFGDNTTVNVFFSMVHPAYEHPLCLTDLSRTTMPSGIVVTTSAFSDLCISSSFQFLLYIPSVLCECPKLLWLWRAQCKQSCQNLYPSEMCRYYENWTFCYHIVNLSVDELYIELKCNQQTNCKACWLVAVCPRALRNSKWVVWFQIFVSNCSQKFSLPSWVRGTNVS